MNKAEANRLLRASDAYPAWTRLVSRAQEQVTVFAPYLDDLLLKMLAHRRPRLRIPAVVVTTLGPTSVLEPSQLRTIRRALDAGIAVLSLPTLHAKVLLVDDRYVILGSQNFTSHGRQAKECSACLSCSLVDTRFVNILISWRSEAEPIDPGLVDRLLAKSHPTLQRQKDTADEANALWNATQAEYKVYQEKRTARRIRRLEQRSSIRLVQGAVQATVRKSHSTATYYSLVADPFYDMTAWESQLPGRAPEPYHLERLAMYPMLAVDDYRMGFVRICKGRVSFVENRLKWYVQQLQFGDVAFGVTLLLPESGTRRRNVIVQMDWGDRTVCELDVFFNASTAKVVGFRVIARDRLAVNHSKLLKSRVFASQRIINRLFRDFFRAYGFCGYNHVPKNIDTYLKGSRYRVSVIEFQRNPFLVMKNVR